MSAPSRSLAKKRPSRTAPARASRPAPRPRPATSRVAVAARATKLRIEPATVERWSDLTALFGSRGACGGCWCMWARRTASEFRTGKGDGNRRALRRRVGQGIAPGLLAYDGDQAVGWIAVGPRDEFVRLESSRVLAPLDETPVWSVPCFFVASTHRGRGVSVTLLAAASAFAAAHGARVLEGYPVDTRGRREPAAFVWWGTVGAFRAAGFREVARRSAPRPIMRRILRATRAKATARG